MDAAWKSATTFFFEHASWKGRHYRGVPIGKNPLDLWVYQEIIERVKPTLIIEFGTWYGGSALWFADTMERVGGMQGRVITVDQTDRHRRHWPNDDRITYIVGGTCEAEVYDQIILESGCPPRFPVLISADSAHRYQHVRNELDLYHSLVTPGSYMVIEDGILDHILHRDGMGAYKAAQDFLAEHPEFEADQECERYGITMHPGGFLRRKA